MPFKCFCRFAIYKFFWLPLIPNKSQCSESNVRSVLLNFKQLFVLPFFSSLCLTWTDLFQKQFQLQFVTEPTYLTQSWASFAVLLP